jgi:hypothetical protein
MSVRSFYRSTRRSPGTRMLQISKSPNQSCRVRNHEKSRAPLGRDSQRADLSAAGPVLSLRDGAVGAPNLTSGPKEGLTRSIACLLVATCAVLAASAAWATESAASRHHRHVTHTTPAPTSERRVPAAESRSLDRFHSPFNPYARPGDGNSDGLSRDPNECNKGCIDGHSG